MNDKQTRLLVTGTLTDWGQGRGAFYDRDEEGTVGTYGVMDPERDALLAKPSDVTCPYCREPMQERTMPYCRIKREMPSGKKLMDFIPATHRVLRCKPCRQYFTQPKAQAV